MEEVIYWIEVHPANEGEVRVVLEKLRALKTWLRTNAQKLNAMNRSFIWISSRTNSFHITFVPGSWNVQGEPGASRASLHDPFNLR